MKGSYHFKVRSKRVIFEFDIQRNITIIKGDSATGKTTLLHMLYEYLRVGKESGYFVSTPANYYVYMRKEVGRDWKEVLLSLENTIIFIEENNNFVFSKDFAEFVKASGNYFVLINRSPLKMLPYSIHEIYEIITTGKKTDIKQSYHEFKELYSNYPIAENNKIDNVIVEDSNSGFQFFSYVLKNSNVISANGNGNIISCANKIQSGDTLAIVDGAAFGAMVEDCIEYFETKFKKRVSVWMPESFEFLILCSGIIADEELKNILESIPDYVDCKKYESWEKFFTELLILKTSNTTYKYSKHLLNEYYLQEKNVKKLIEHFPNEISKILEE